MLKMMLHIPTPRYTPERKCGSMEVSITVVVEGDVGEVGEIGEVGEAGEAGGEEVVAAAAARES